MAEHLLEFPSEGLKAWFSGRALARHAQGLGFHLHYQKKKKMSLEKRLWCHPGKRIMTWARVGPWRWRIDHGDPAF